MRDVPKFNLYGVGDANIMEALQPQLPLREWSELAVDEKATMLQTLQREGFVGPTPDVAIAMERLNQNFLRLCPARELHKYPQFDRSDQAKRAAHSDFARIFVSEESSNLVLTMLSLLADEFISRNEYRWATEATKLEEREEHIKDAFRQFDHFAASLNKLFDQFSVNILVTREGFVPKQDEKIAKTIYEPTLRVLTDPRWKPVSNELNRMFAAYHSGDHPAVITSAHNVVHRFLGVALGKDGASGKGDFGKLFAEAKTQGVIPTSTFTEGIVTTIQRYLPSERAQKGSAKPSAAKAEQPDSLLIMNVVMVLLQHCLQHSK